MNPNADFTEDALLLKSSAMARFKCGRYEIECGPGPEWRFVNIPPVVEGKTEDDLRALAVVAKAAAEWDDLRVAADPAAPAPSVRDVVTSNRAVPGTCAHVIAAARRYLAELRPADEREQRPYFGRRDALHHLTVALEQYDAEEEET